MFKIIGNNRYMIIFKETDVDKLVEQKFPILQEIHGIKAGQHTATVSIGLCRGINSLKDSETNARKALDMALGRGGDQVAIISNNIYEFSEVLPLLPKRSARCVCVLLQMQSSVR